MVEYSGGSVAEPGGGREFFFGMARRESLTPSLTASRGNIHCALPGKSGRQIVFSTAIQHYLTENQKRVGLKNKTYVVVGDAYVKRDDLANALGKLFAQKAQEESGVEAGKIETAARILQRTAKNCLKEEIVDLSRINFAPLQSAAESLFHRVVIEPAKVVELTFIDELEGVADQIAEDSSGNYFDLESERSFQEKAEVVITDAERLTRVVSEAFPKNVGIQAKAAHVNKIIDTFYEQGSRHERTRCGEAIQSLKFGGVVSPQAKITQVEGWLKVELKKRELLQAIPQERLTDTQKGLVFDLLNPPQPAAHLTGNARIQAMRAIALQQNQKLDRLFGRIQGANGTRVRVGPDILPEEIILIAANALLQQDRLKSVRQELELMKDAVIDSITHKFPQLDEDDFATACNLTIDAICRTLGGDVSALQEAGTYELEPDFEISFNKFSAAIKEELKPILRKFHTAAQKEAFLKEMETFLKPLEAQYENTRIDQAFQDRINPELQKSAFSSCAETLRALEELIGVMDDVPEKAKCIHLRQELTQIFETLLLTTDAKTDAAKNKFFEDECMKSQQSKEDFLFVLTKYTDISNEMLSKAQNRLIEECLKPTTTAERKAALMGVLFGRGENALSDDVKKVCVDRILNERHVASFLNAKGYYVGDLPKRKPFAKGGFGCVYEIIKPAGISQYFEKRAGAQAGEELFALKVLNTPIPPKEWEKVRPMGERIGAVIDSPNVLQLTDVVHSSGGVNGTVTKLIKGKDFSKIMKELESLVPMEKRRVAKPIFLQIAKGLKALHDRGIAHLDFHPGNVMIEVSEERGQPVFGQVKVMDFGTSVSVNPYMPEPAGGEVGKNLYLSPEMREKRPVTTKADVFGLGQMMYKFFEGRQFSGDIGALEFRNIQDESLQVLIRSFLQPDPEDRGSVDDLFRCAFFRS